MIRNFITYVQWMQQLDGVIFRIIIRDTSLICFIGNGLLNR